MSRICEETLASLYRVAADRYGDLPAFATKIKGEQYDFLSYRRLYERGLALATALIHLGLRAREHVGLLADNRAEWIVCDYGILLAGCADVPRGTDVTESEIVYILNHADTRFVFLEDEEVLAKFEKVRPELRGVEKIILMAPKAAPPRGVLRLEDLVTLGETLRAEGDRRAEERAQAVRPEDLFTLIYTSGTTGTPKGVQLTHANMASQIGNLPFNLAPGDRMLSILPIWHSYERIFEMVSISMGACTYYTNVRQIGEDLKIVRPTLMASAPRLWESLYQKIMARVEKAPAYRRALFHAARISTSHVKRAERFFVGQQLDLSGRGLSENLSLGAGHLLRWILFFLPHRALDRIVLAKLRESVGCGDFRGTISGGGALQPHVDEFFNFIGIPVLEGYGLTETSPVLAVRTWSNLVIGTVGRPYPGTEIRIVDLQTGATLYPDKSHRDGGRGRRGEIHAQGPQIMQGYYKNPGETSRVLRDGWLNTGDIGVVTFNDCLKILGRSKDTIVLLNGENVEPVPLEARLTELSLIDHGMVVGQDQKFLGALIVPALESFRAAGIQAANLQELAASEPARKLLEVEIRQLISPANGFKAFERIADFRFVSKPFETGDELTATFKLKRHVITGKYSALMAEMYPPQNR